MKIADASNGRCVARAFSIMRLALGYKEPLPFPIDFSPDGSQMPGLIGECFPNHNILLWCEESAIEGADIPSNIEHLGTCPDGQSLNEYLWSFSYTEKDESQAHFVIGSPALSLTYYQIFAIELGDCGKED